MRLIAALQVRSTPGELHANLTYIMPFAEQAALQDEQLIVFPDQLDPVAE